jgi:predicted transport protein
MSNKLWVFGDSYSETFRRIQGGIYLNWKKNYVDFKGYEPKVFSDIVAEELNLELVNTNLKGESSDNATIFSRIINNIDNIKKGDVISVGWTTVTRYRVVNFNSKSWDIINPGHPIIDYPNLSEQTFQEIGINRTHKLYFNELCEWVEVVNKLFKENKIIQWTWTMQHSMKHHTIIEETDGLLEDYHWSEKGHQDFAKWFLDCYNNNVCFDFFNKR